MANPFEYEVLILAIIAVPIIITIERNDYLLMCSHENHESCSNGKRMVFILVLYMTFYTRMDASCR